GGRLLGDRETRSRGPGIRIRDGPARGHGVRRPARRTGAAAHGDGLHPAALPRPVAFLPAVAAGTGDRRPAGQRPCRQRRRACRARRAATAVELLVGAAAGHAAVGTAVPAAGFFPPRSPELSPWSVA